MWTYVNNELDAQYSKPLPEVSRLKEDCLPMAALKRIISVMPDNVEQKQYLIEKIINSGK